MSLEFEISEVIPASPEDIYAAWTSSAGHSAMTGSGNEAVQELHRIEAVFARRDIEAHGFEFAGELQTLENTSDPLDISVFDPSVRRKTSRFVYKFIEPAD